MRLSIRRGWPALLLAMVMLLAPLDGLAKGSRSGSSTYSGSHRSYSSSNTSRTKCPTCERDSHGRILRSEEAVTEFKRTHPKPPVHRLLVVGSAREASSTILSPPRWLGQAARCEPRTPESGLPRVAPTSRLLAQRLDFIRLHDQQDLAKMTHNGEIGARG